MHASAAVEEYAVAIVRATREHPDLRLGASPRATLQLVRAAKVRAALDGRRFVLPDDVEASMYVHPANAGPGLNADQISASTIARQPDLSAPRRPAAPPGVLIFLALLGALAGLWMLERMRPARTPRGEAATGSDGG